jgi:hypothetical protein
MIIINLAGGLGNQMFQYATGLALSLETGQTTKYSTDTIGTHSTPRSLQLTKVFNLTINQADANDVKRVVGNLRGQQLARKLCAKPHGRYIRGSRFISDDRLKFSPNLASRCSEGAYLHGYWQSEAYFQRYQEHVLESFKFGPFVDVKNIKSREEIVSSHSIGVHVRRGDYVATTGASQTHYALPESYYFSAIAKLRGKTPRAKVFFFSDDSAWVKKNLCSKINNSEVIDHNTGKDHHHDMQLLSLCDSLVIANSSFSWWAAWLNRKQQKAIIAPARWFATNRLDGSSIIPRDWDVGGLD